MFALIVAICFAGAARAQDDPAFLSVGAGVFDINDSQKAGEVRLEYRFARRFWMFKPFFGASGTTDAAAYGYGGVLIDIHFGPRWVLMPSAAFGLYRDGSGKKLGHAAEFRTGAELAYRFDNRSRLGLAFHHISNASIGEKNPGTEILSLIYSAPFDSHAK
ncbi:MAG: acyloxyacyl hydrolase [Alphaproteobacteria bacterium]|nr:acyloxyacyl hydrolase [Alphaproteobacteria bacterium]